MARALFVLLLACLPAITHAQETEGLPLEAWVAGAIAKNPARSISRAALLTAESDRLRAASNLLPTVRAQASYTYNQYESFFFSPDPIDPVNNPPTKILIAPHDTQEAFVTARLPLLDVPTLARWRGARAGATAAEHDDAVSEQDVALAAARAYYAAVAASQVVHAAERAKAVADENLRIVTARLAAGATTPLNQQRADFEVARAEQVVIEARRQWLSARRALASISGLPEPDALSAPPPSIEALPAEADLLAKALASRPDLAAAATRVDVARRARTASWAQYAPTVSATGTERYTNATGFSGRETSWTVGVTAEWLLFDAGSRVADVRLAKASILRAEAQAESQRSAVRDEVHNAWLDVDAARAKLAAARRGDEVAQRAADEARARFKAGTSTQLELIQADRDRLQAEVDRIRAESDLSIARLALAKSAGERLATAAR